LPFCRNTPGPAGEVTTPALFRIIDQSPT
jgi:hypothetical protein